MKKVIKLPNPIAKSLRSNHLRNKVIRNKKLYKRISKHTMLNKE